MDTETAKIERALYTKEELAGKVRGALKTAIGLNAKVKLVEPDTLEHSQGKSKHVIDKRKLYE